jgi:parallel beta-helix repeat protein
MLEWRKGFMQNSWLKKGFLTGIILILIGANVVSVLSMTVSIDYSSQNRGKILYVGGNGPGNYTYIQDAINDASAGDIVFVYNGTYFENIRVTKSIFLIGDDKNTTIIDGSLNGSAIITLTDEVTIQNFTIQNSDEIGIEVKSNYTKILGNDIKNNNWAGVRIEGVLNKKRHDNFISGNTITNNNSWGIYLWFTTQNTITKNVISYNKRNGIEGILSDFTTITENKIFNNQGQGIYLWGNSDDNTIFANTIKDNGGGIRIKESYYMNITKNNFENNGINLFISSGNLISKNNFFQCSASFSYVRGSNNIWKGNYWNRPRLIPKPIIGQIGDTILHGTVYIPRFPWVNFDWFPTKEPYNIPGMR